MTTERSELTVNDVTQHVHQHAGEPRDIDYRGNALNAALSYHASGGYQPEASEVVTTAGTFEAYLRDGATTEGEQ